MARFARFRAGRRYSALECERWPRLVHAGAMLGQMALTIYVLHVLSLWLFGPWLRHDEVVPALIAAKTARKQRIVRL